MELRKSIITQLGDTSLKDIQEILADVRLWDTAAAAAHNNEKKVHQTMPT